MILTFFIKRAIYCLRKLKIRKGAQEGGVKQRIRRIQEQVTLIKQLLEIPETSKDEPKVKRPDNVVLFSKKFKYPRPGPAQRVGGKCAGVAELNAATTAQAKVPSPVPIAGGP